MFRVEQGGSKYEFSFEHLRFKSWVIDGTHAIKGKTVCTLFTHYRQLGQDKILKVYGVSDCSVSDNFNKETGRKLALSRALKAGNVPREARAAIWRAYFGRSTSYKESIRLYPLSYVGITPVGAL